MRLPQRSRIDRQFFLPFRGEPAAAGLHREENKEKN